MRREPTETGEPRPSRDRGWMQQDRIAAWRVLCTNHGAEMMQKYQPRLCAGP
jgi:hypothetical protein